MRLDKFLCDALGATRKEATKIIKSGDITVNEKVQKSGAFKVTEESCVEWQGREINRHGPRYIMLYKPQGYVCSHEDGFNHTAFVLLDEVNMDKLHFAGRLDVDTTGLVLITDDGKWSHKITSPKHKCEKRYRVWLVDAVEDDYVQQFQAGIELRNEREATLPAQLEIIDSHQVLLTITEGKYHQVKRMFAALGNKVEALHREQIGSIELDHELEPGEYRYLSEDEVNSIWR
ncbi:ribosomal small subunit pseudouridine synthase A [Vibrio sp. MACH09]|uniref:16S rRNA pseudouridine(516) synthase RsuA n=1 Tax=unclassified Vibrio TaxID=2614977 RepID=UPI0014934B58|nr:MULTISPECIES: 16S rRNA pseudouridine(516) synthase RsuA [unclassified Vibrio]NOI67475.1 16S rRNA pseudouridine(516) synthase RsuA [Vibrio sp. 99-8-1]GLO60788.1 ribosomal small subunit pseudouridine synthase A [Vibrio sp. MACH09]